MSTVETVGVQYGTEYPELFAALMAEFESFELRTRPQGGRQLTYVTARAVMNRLDSVVGPENWYPEYTETKAGMKCRLWIRLPNGEWKYKEDGGGFAGMAESDNNEKSAFSDSFKRAGAAWGIARYLYQDGQPDFVPEPVHQQPRQQPSQAQQRQAVVHGHANGNGYQRPQNGPPAQRQQGGGGNGRAPSSGRGLFAWSKEQGEKYGLDMVKYLQNWGKLQGIDKRMVDFDDEEIALVHGEGVRKLAELNGGGDGGNGGADENDTPF